MRQEYQWRTTFPSGAKLRSFSSCALGPADRRGNRISDPLQPAFQFIFSRVHVVCCRGNLYTLTAVLPESEVVDGQGAAPLIPEIIEGFIVQPESD